MNRNFPRYSRPTGNSEQLAISCNTSYEVWAAIELVAKMNNRNPVDVWENPARVEGDNVEMCLNDWAIHGDIEPGTYAWGCENIVVSAE